MKELLIGKDGLLSALPAPAAHIAAILITVAATLLFAKLLLIIVRGVIKRCFRRIAQRKNSEATARKAQTVSRLMCGTASFIVWFIAAATVLDTLDLGVTSTSLLATAGIGGIAVGIGAKSFIGDIVNGFMLMLENQYSIGDYIDADGTVGKVENISLRTTTLRRDNNELAMIPNGQIMKVINYTRDDYIIFFEYPVSYSADIARAGELMAAAAGEYALSHDDVTQPPVFVGPVEVLPKAVRLRMTVRVRPMARWQVSRDLYAAVTRVFKENGIETPDYESFVSVGRPQ